MECLAHHPTETDTWIVALWEQDGRSWPQRMELARHLGAFLIGDRLAVDRLLDHTPEGSPQEDTILDLHAAVHRDDVPGALAIFATLPQLVERVRNGG